MTEYARAQAANQQVEDRVQFRVMDALRMLEFPPGSFDLVNQRLGTSYLRTWDWPKLLNEYKRVTRPGGVIRITESDMVTQSSSPAVLRFNSVIFQALCQAGHYFTRESDGVTSQLARLLHQYGLQNVQTHAYTMEYRAGTAQGQLYYEDAKRATQTLLPFLRKWTHVPEDYETLCQQVLSEIQQPDFVATWRLLTAWGYNEL
jgi:ubiquinone/menaquinone biosynthesis C-methylase UbiE